MDIEIAKMERMAQTGSSLLRLIQNSHTPTLDLLVREAIQNSLDATRNENEYVKFDIDIIKFRNKLVSRHFKGIDHKLLNKYNEIESSIVLRDSNTVGLTGPIHQDYVKNNEYGNLLKLIYEISMPQEKKEAGGSWGLGKTVYFRIGIGLVIYYSRIALEDGIYESRLAACLIEDESSENAIIPSSENNKRGIAWWGEVHHTESGEYSTKPITNEVIIEEILNDFNVLPYEGEQTGTTVIIPYIDEDKLLIVPESDEENNQYQHFPNWYQNIDRYLNLSIQRWYAPRIDNPTYQYGSYLKPSIGNSIITKDKMEPMFRVIRGLYIYAEVNEKDELINQSNLRNKDVVVYRDMINNVAGKVAFIKIDKSSLQMKPPYNKWSPYDHIDELSYSGLESNVPIICYTRKPGMIINYELDSKWTQGIEVTNKDEYIIGIFVPDSDNILKLPKISLDEYLRQGEKADHSSWKDTNINDKRFTIVERIQKRTAQAVKEAFNKKVEKIEGTRSGALSTKLATSLLPPIGFGKAADPGIKPTPPKVQNKQVSLKNSIKIIESITNDNRLTLKVKVIPKENHKLIIESLVESEGNRKIRGNAWEEDIGTQFPVEIEGIELTNKEEAQVILERTDIHSITNKIHMKPTMEIDSYLLKIKLLITESLIQPDISFKFHKEVTVNE